VIRKFKLLDGAVDSLENTEREDLRAELEARFALMSHELRRLFSVLEPALKLSKVEA
jgi:recombination associated protein RdgC